LSGEKLKEKNKKQTSVVIKKSIGRPLFMNQGQVSLKKGIQDAGLTVLNTEKLN